MEDLETLRRELEELKIKNSMLEDKLKSRYNKATSRHRKYYENNSDLVKERAKKYMEKIKLTHPEKLKEYTNINYNLNTWTEKRKQDLVLGLV